MTDSNTFATSLESVSQQLQKLVEFTTSLRDQAVSMYPDMAPSLQSLVKAQSDLMDFISNIAGQSQLSVCTNTAVSDGPSFFVTGLTVFVLACFVGYYVVWRVTPELHSPLMAVTNAISSVIIIGALLAAAPEDITKATWLGLTGVVLASINIFGGFIVTERMLHMYRKKGK